MSYSFLLPSHKADRLFEGNWILIHEDNTGKEPISLFVSYITLRDVLFPLNPELWL